MMILRTAFVLLAITSFGESAAMAKTPAAKRHAASRPTPSEPMNVVAMAGPTLGRRELVTNKCVSGGRFSFRGADIFDETTKEVFVLRLVLDPIAGPVVRIYTDSEFGKSIILRRRNCKTFEYELASTGKSVNFVTEMRVAVQLDCRTRKGDFVVGKVELPACL
ncbi:MAG TPA: hypothetical protein VLV54_17550 [Thermoanaerobaculia bacterium]|nr:hypothetical protein [Thermoanaerobaculia bacterium]